MNQDDKLRNAVNELGVCKCQQMELPPRKFKLGEYVWATLGGLVHYACVFGHEDGRRFHKSPYLGWIYHVTLTGADDQTPRCANAMVREDQLRKIDEGSE